MDIEKIKAALKPCPFCGASPHQGLDKAVACQLHGELSQTFTIKCPHGHAKITAVDRETAIGVWNTRMPDKPLKRNAALEKIASQKLSEEFYSDILGEPNWCEGYDEIVKLARSALSPALVKEGVVERVARAIASAQGWDIWDTARDFRDTPTGNEPEEERQHYLEVARAAIAAMNSPAPMSVQEQKT